MSHPEVFYRIWVYDPGHFTPYYNAGLCGQFAAMGLDCTLVTSAPAFEAVAAKGYEVQVLFFRMLLGRAGEVLRRRAGLRRMVKALLYPAGVWRTYRMLRGEAPGVFHIHFAVMPVLDAWLAGGLRRRGWRVVYTLQQPHPEGVWERWQFGRLMEHCDRIVMHEEGLAARLREIYPGLAGRIGAVTHGMDLPELAGARARAQARAAMGVGPDEPLLLFFGMIKPYKGLEELLEAMPAVLQRVPKARLCIAGEPLMEMSRVRAGIARLPEGVVLERLGFVPQSEVGPYFAAADLVVACYREIAASSVVLQAQAHGKAVLVARVGAMEALVEEGRCGFLAGEDLAESIVRALGDAEGLAEAGRRGRARVERLHGWKRVAEETLRLYPVGARVVRAAGDGARRG